MSACSGGLQMVVRGYGLTGIDLSASVFPYVSMPMNCHKPTIEVGRFSGTMGHIAVAFGPTTASESNSYGHRIVRR